MKIQYFNKHTELNYVFKYLLQVLLPGSFIFLYMEDFKQKEAVFYTFILLSLKCLYLLSVFTSQVLPPV